jgi:hypothetical protein
MYDTVAQYSQVRGVPIDDWHPPIMVRLWQLLHPLGPGTAPIFGLQTALYAFGFALIAGALVESGRWRAALATAVLALSPLLLGWQMVVLKDAQMLGALVAVFGIVAHYRLTGRSIPVAAGAVVVLLVAYATLVRANAFFVTVSLASLLLPTRKRLLMSAAIAAAGAAIILIVTPPINHGLLGAEPSDVAKSQPLFDLAAIAIASPASPGPFTPSEIAEIRARHCVKAFFWDPLGDPTGCTSATERLMQEPASWLYVQLARAAVAHPIAYARHRIAHWDSTERWLVAPGLPDAAPPVEAEPNDLGLETPQSPIAGTWQDIAAAEAATPLGWPIFWTIVAAVLLPAAWRRRNDPSGSLALALVASALALEISFFAISIASDLRYHLWPMAASALALILLSDNPRLQHREWLGAGLVVALVIGGGIVARATLPPAPDSYQAMIHAASG